MKGESKDVLNSIVLMALALPDDVWNYKWTLRVSQWVLKRGVLVEGAETRALEASLCASTEHQNLTLIVTRPVVELL